VRRQEQELGELDRHFLGLADELGAANKNLTGEVDHLADQLDAEINEAIRQCSTWLERARPQDRTASRPSEAARTVSGQRRHRLRAAWPRQRAIPATGSQEPRYRYQQILELLTKFRTSKPNCQGFLSVKAAPVHSARLRLGGHPMGAPPSLASPCIRRWGRC